MHPAQILSAFADCVRQQKAGRFATAIAGYQAILQTAPNHFDAWHLLGVAYLQTGQPQSAIDAIRRAIALHGGNAAFHNNLGVALLAHGDLAGAKSAFMAAVALKADYADAVANLGLAASRQGDVSEAVQHFREALRLQPRHVDALFNLGNLLFEQGQLDEAIGHYQKAAATASSRCDILNNLGRALLEKGNAAEASDCFGRALVLEPRFGEAAFNAGKALAQMERTQDAIAAYQNAARLRPQKPLWRLQHLGLCPTVFQSEAELDEYRAELERRLEQLLVRFRKTLGSAVQRIVFLPPQSPLQLRQLMSVCDALLDIHHYSVSLMARDAFAANLPIVTLPGRFKVERYALGFYRKVGIRDLIAASPADYVSMAVRLGKDRDFRQCMKERIGAASGVLFEDRHCIAEFERFAESV